VCEFRAGYRSQAHVRGEERRIPPGTDRFIRLALEYRGNPRRRHIWVPGVLNANWRTLRWALTYFVADLVAHPSSPGVVPSSDGTRFTNGGTGHGMFVSIDNVYSF
jgi:hypothetical protein